MAGLGEFYSLSQSDLQAAFDRAKADGKDYLVKLGYSSMGMPMTMPGYSFALDMIDFHEASLAVTTDSMYDDFKAFLTQHDGGKVEAVYDLSVAFKDAVLPAEDAQGVTEAFTRARDDYEAEQHQARMDARPLWRKVLGLQPK